MSNQAGSPLVEPSPEQVEKFMERLFGVDRVKKSDRGVRLVVEIDTGDVASVKDRLEELAETLVNMDSYGQLPECATWRGDGWRADLTTRTARSSASVSEKS